MIDKKIEEIYKELDNRIKQSKQYIEFAHKISLDSDTNKNNNDVTFRDIFTFEKEVETSEGIKLISNFDSEVASKAFSHIGVMKKVCDILNLDNEFHDVIIKANESSNVLVNICNTHFLNVKYGDPSNETLNDYSLNDRLFYIIETIFGLDTIVNSYYDKDAFNKQLNYIMQDYSGTALDNLTMILEDMYNELKDEKDEETIKNRIREYKDALKPYVSAGIQAQIDETIRSDKKSYDNVTRLEETVIKDILGYSLNKKM
ncbi:MAG: hypothetical protein IJ094_03100 [Bacilli bacterium]|nr:hypothetical protein [Bacilli bacterium]